MTSAMQPACNRMEWRYGMASRWAAVHARTVHVRLKCPSGTASGLV